MCFFALQCDAVCAVRVVGEWVGCGRVSLSDVEVELWGPWRQITRIRTVHGAWHMAAGSWPVHGRAHLKSYECDFKILHTFWILCDVWIILNLSPVFTCLFKYACPCPVHDSHWSGFGEPGEALGRSRVVVTIQSLSMGWHQSKCSRLLQTSWANILAILLICKEVSLRFVRWLDEVYTCSVCWFSQVAGKGHVKVKAWKETNGLCLICRCGRCRSRPQIRHCWRYEWYEGQDFLRSICIACINHGAGWPHKASSHMNTYNTYAAMPCNSIYIFVSSPTSA
jgi:hypothetical protein